MEAYRGARVALQSGLWGNNNIQIKEEYFDILRDQEITGSTFFKITEETYRSYGLKGGPAKIFVEFAKDFMEKKKRPFSSYKTLTDLKSVLNKFNIYGSSLSAVPQFTPSSLSLADDDDELQQCMNDIKHAGNLGEKLTSLDTRISRGNSRIKTTYTCLCPAPNILPIASLSRLRLHSITISPYLYLLNDFFGFTVELAFWMVDNAKGLVSTCDCLLRNKGYLVLIVIFYLANF
ncbi:hypothetical protein RhiirA1_402921 [Rhizophagus irregularis]|uniref:Uncharacterized protein n=1 Tax=Rhizophagus irregularis TaxID=588596 RepID=A0A2N0QWH3_9GLOM|nr:hypothetical protein RhiirA1_402921 [Rhizophagus irregularis]